MISKKNFYKFHERTFCDCRLRSRDFITGYMMHMKNVLQTLGNLMVPIKVTSDTFIILYVRRKRFLSILRKWYPGNGRIFWRLWQNYQQINDALYLWAPLKFFLGFKSKIRFRGIVALDVKNTLDTHYVVFGRESVNPNSQTLKKNHFTPPPGCWIEITSFKYRLKLFKTKNPP